ncbi:hypothetical protein LBWT_X4570 (plasmid) [Leptolyngbya boryana IAM M-101]|nr:hypothetical protein LBWT_X4570 [Leptolyngbya boryana IAM M-101]BAS66733.1 hypothetical protein LBDG_X4570 [Leptolyngbya boryana dg5]
MSTLWRWHLLFLTKISLESSVAGESAQFEPEDSATILVFSHGSQTSKFKRTRLKNGGMG